VIFTGARVKLNSTSPLIRFVPLTLEGQERMFLEVKYEKLPKYCEHCGYMGHVYLECGTREHAEDARQFGPWMVVEEIFWKAGTLGVHTHIPDRSGGSMSRAPREGRGGTSAGRGYMGEHTQRRWNPKET
jgi:hypothetical protein